MRLAPRRRKPATGSVATFRRFARHYRLFQSLAGCRIGAITGNAFFIACTKAR
jgi:hypothetical protein